MTEIEARTVNVGASPVARGLRVTLLSTGLVALAGIGVRGDFVTRQDIAANESGEAISMSGGENAVVAASEASVVGNLAYSAANGQVSQTAAGAVVVGRWTQAASGAGVLGEIELLSIA
jgi:hypothetical protein